MTCFSPQSWHSESIFCFFFHSLEMVSHETPYGLAASQTVGTNYHDTFSHWELRSESSDSLMTSHKILNISIEVTTTKTGDIALLPKEQRQNCCWIAAKKTWTITRPTDMRLAHVLRNTSRLFHGNLFQFILVAWSLKMISDLQNLPKILIGIKIWALWGNFLFTKSISVPVYPTQSLFMKGHVWIDYSDVVRCG